MTRPVLLAVVVWVALIAAPAAAHTRAAVASDVRSEITDDPALRGITWSLYPAGEYLELENVSDRVVVVVGYEGEPYLRVGPSGVEQNLNSPATYLNSRRDGDVALPPRADAAAAPEWDVVSDEPRYAWFDHRVHPMPGDGVWSEGSGRWDVGFRLGSETYSLGGRTYEDPGPPWWQPLAVAGVAIGGALLILRRLGRDPLASMASVVVAVALFNLIHLPDEVAALPATWVDIGFGLLHNLVFIGVGVVAGVLAIRRDSGLALAVGSIAVAFHQGILQTKQLGASQIPTLWPAMVVRVAVALSIVQLAYALAIAMRSRRADLDEMERERGTAAETAAAGT